MAVELGWKETVPGLHAVSPDSRKDTLCGMVIGSEMMMHPGTTTFWMMVVVCLTAIPMMAQGGSSLTEKQIEVVSPVLKGLADVLRSLHDRYPELEGIDTDKIIRKTETSIGVEFSRNFTRPREKRGILPKDWGAKGIVISFSCGRSTVPNRDHEHASSCEPPGAILTHYGLEVYYQVLVGPDATSGVFDEVTKILAKHAAILEEMDKKDDQPAAGADPVKLRPAQP